MKERAEEKELWWRLAHNDVPGQIIIVPMPERPRERPLPVYQKTVKEEIEDIKIEIVIRDIENLIIEDAISALLAEEEEMNNSAAELLSSQIEENIIDELIVDMTLFESYSLDIEDEAVVNSIESAIDSLLVGCILELLSESQEIRSQGCRTPRALRKMISEARSPSNESDTTAEISFSSESFDSGSDRTIISSFMMGEGSNI